jgi:predicted methyltransferase
MAKTGTGAFLRSAKGTHDPTVEVMRRISIKPVSVADIVGLTGMPLGQIMDLISQLQSAGLIGLDDGTATLTPSGKQTLSALERN